MRIAILLAVLILVSEAAAQEESQTDRYGRPALPEDTSVPLATESASPGTERPIERPLGQPTEGAALPVDSVESQRQTQWQAATKLVAYEASETDTAPQPTTAATPHAQEQCLDPSKFQPGQVGYLDYYLFTIVDKEPKEVYLAGEQGKEPFCLTNVDTEDLEKEEEVVVTGNVIVRGIKTYKTETGDKKSVRVVKLLSKKESEVADAERALLETEHPMRAWTSKDGKHKIEARFVKFAAGKVHLVNKAGKSITIAPNDLSLADRQYYRDLVKKAREAARQKTDDEDAVDEPEPFAGER